MCHGQPPYLERTAHETSTGTGHLRQREKYSPPAISLSAEYCSERGGLRKIIPCIDNGVDTSGGVHGDERDGETVGVSFAWSFIIVIIMRAGRRL